MIPLGDLGSAQVAALRHFTHLCQRLICGAAERVHQDALGLIDDRTGARRIAQLNSRPLRVSVFGDGAHQPAAIGD